MLRCNRQIVLCSFDFDDQERLKAARVLVVGLGRLGCVAAQYLAAASVSQLALLDFDTVSLFNLQRQMLHSDTTIDQPKVDSVREVLVCTNPHVRLVSLNVSLDETALAGQIANHGLVLDRTDNVTTRNQLNAGCFQYTTPLVSGAVIHMEGQISAFTYQDGGPYYRYLSRLFGENAPTYVEAGVMVPLAGTTGSLQTMEAIKPLTGYGTPASRKIAMYDVMTCQFREMKLMRHPQCEVCDSH